MKELIQFYDDASVLGRQAARYNGPESAWSLEEQRAAYKAVWEAAGSSMLRERSLGGRYAACVALLESEMEAQLDGINASVSDSLDTFCKPVGIVCRSFVESLCRVRPSGGWKHYVRVNDSPSEAALSLAPCMMRTCPASDRPMAK